MNSIILRDLDGNLLDISKKAVETRPTLNNPSIVYLVSSPTGTNFRGGYVFKKSKRSQAVYTETTAAKIMAGFTGASAQRVEEIQLEKIRRWDNIIGNRTDYEYLKTGKGGDLIAMDIADYLLTGEELDLKWFFDKVDGLTAAMKIYTAVSATGAATGNQPVQSANTVVAAKEALSKGRRNLVATDIDADNALDLVRSVISYLHKIGSPKSVETLYPWSINGLPLSSQRILTTYDGVMKLRDSFTTAYIDLSNPNSLRNYNGIVGVIDTVPVYLTNQIGEDVFARILTDRSFTRDMDNVINYAGVVSPGDGKAIKLSNGDIVNVSPSEVNTAMDVARVMGAIYFEEVITIKEAV